MKAKKIERPYTDKEWAEMLEMKERGATVPEIAEKFGRTANAVYVKFNYEKKRKEYRNQQPAEAGLNAAKNQVEKADSETAMKELKKCVEKINLPTQENETLRRELDSARSDALNSTPPRDIIRHLYGLGYRIENGNLFVVTKRQVILSDILNENA